MESLKVRPQNCHIKSMSLKSHSGGMSHWREITGESVRIWREKNAGRNKK